MKRIDLMIQTGGFKAGEHLIVTDVPVPQATEEDRVIIQVKASAVNPVDWKMAEYGILLPEKLPAALGCDVAGVVVQSSSTSLAVGSRVVTFLDGNKTRTGTSRGAFVEQVAVDDPTLVARIPDDSMMSFAEAATLPTGALTAELLLHSHHPAKWFLEQDSYLLIWGASSSLGYNCVQLAVQRGCKVIAVASGKHEAAMKELGVAAFVDYRKDDVASKVAEICAAAAASASSPSGNDALAKFLNGAVDCIGEPTSFETCADLVKRLGDSSLITTADSSLAITTANADLRLVDAPPVGVKKYPVRLGLEQEECRALVQKWLPEIVLLKPMPIYSIKGPFAAETVEKALQANKDGVSGEKVVIEWTTDTDDE